METLSNFHIEPYPLSEFLPTLKIRTNEGREARAKKEALSKPRMANRVTGVVLHQMGFSRGDEADKYDAVTAHFIITQAGNIAQLHTVEENLYSSNHLNDFTIAVEFAGNFRNDKGHWWKGNPVQYRLTRRQASAGIFLLELVKSAYEISTVFAHRQGTGPRKGNCCGPEIWCSIAEHAILHLGYQDTRDQVFGNGAAIPQSWRRERIVSLKGTAKMMFHKEGK